MELRVPPSTTLARSSKLASVPAAAARNAPPYESLRGGRSRDVLRSMRHASPAGGRPAGRSHQPGGDSNERLAGAAVVAASLHGYNWWRRAVVVAWCGTLVVRSTR